MYNMYMYYAQYAFLLYNNIYFFLDFEQSEEYINFKMICVFFFLYKFIFQSVYTISSRNNATISFISIFSGEEKVNLVVTFKISF